MEKKETRGRIPKLLYSAFDTKKVLLKVPEYESFKKMADEKGVEGGVVELIYRILLAEISEYQKIKGNE